MGCFVTISVPKEQLGSDLIAILFALPDLTTKASSAVGPNTAAVPATPLLATLVTLGFSPIPAAAKAKSNTVNNAMGEETVRCGGSLRIPSADQDTLHLVVVFADLMYPTAAVGT